MEIIIQDAVSACISELREYYGSEACIKNDMEHIYTPLLRFCKKKKIVYYDKKIVDLFITEHQKYWKSEKYANRVKSGLQRIIDLMENGKISFKRKGYKKYIPYVPENIELANEIIKSNKGYESRTVAAIIRHFFCYIESKKITVKDVTDQIYLDFLTLRKTVNPKTPRFTREALTLISNYLKLHNIAKTKLDFSKLKIEQSHFAVIKPFTKQEIASLYNILETKLKIRNRAIINLSIITGLRFSDIANLKLSDIDWDHKIIRLKQKKTGSPLTIPMNYVIQNEIAQYILKERPQCNEKEVFITYKAPYKKLTRVPKEFEQLCLQANIEKIEQRSFHSLRRTFASSLSEEHVSLSTISQLLGHKNSDYDRPYLSYDTEKMSFCSLDLTHLPVLSNNPM